MSQSTLVATPVAKATTKKATTTRTVEMKPRIARRIVRNYLRIALIANLEPEALPKTALERAERQLNRVPGYKLVKSGK